MIRMVWMKIIKKFLFIPGVKRRLERVGQLYETDRIEKERDIFSREHEVYPLDFTSYLPDTEERIERLRRVINKRPVAIILRGPSLTELEERITELEGCDICYSTQNVFRPSEEHILRKINRNISLFMCSSPFALYQEINNHNLIDFLERQEDNFFISETDSLRSLEPKMSQGFDSGKFIEKYDKKTLFFTSAYTSITMREGLSPRIPSIEYPLHFPRQNTFSILLSLAVIGGASMVVFFGGDGGRIEGRELFYRGYGWTIPEQTLEKQLAIDTRLFNVTMPLILEKIYKMYNLRPVDIVNCSVQSRYTPFRKLSYDETFALLKSFKKDADST